MAQLAEWLLLIPEVCGSNSGISEIFDEHLFTVDRAEKTKIKKMVDGMAHF